MPSKHPRVAITIPQKYKATYDEAAALMGMPTSKFILEMLIESEPTVKALHKPLKHIQKLRSGASSDAAQVLKEMDSGASKMQIDIEDFIKTKK
jgi:hypothetical protein